MILLLILILFLASSYLDEFLSPLFDDSPEASSSNPLYLHLFHLLSFPIFVIHYPPSNSPSLHPHSIKLNQLLSSSFWQFDSSKSTSYSCEFILLHSRLKEENFQMWVNKRRRRSDNSFDGIHHLR